MPQSAKLLASLLVVPLAIFLAFYSDTFSNSDILAFIPGLSKSLATSPTVQVASSNIAYVGKVINDVEQYLGIYYAQDTSGANRFAPPRSLSQKAGTVTDATKSGPWCPQGTGDILPFTSKVTNIGENCLSLGITRPRDIKVNARLPVLVWMHGGGHALGSYADQLYAPQGLVQQAVADGKPVIFVGINYRLGMFGFGRSKALLKAGYTNAGLRDQRAALEWVQKNIASFGGNPDNIISIGQSVGASDTGLHITSYGGERGVPFSKAVMMSGAPGLTFNIESDQVDQNTASVAEAVGCAINGDTQSQAALKCLQKVPMERLMNVSVTAMRAARPPFGEAYFYPTIDGDYIPARPSELLKQGKFVKNIPVIASWVTNDGAWYVPPSTTTDDEVTGSFTLWLSNLSKSTLSKLLELYPISDFEQIASSSSAIGGLSPQYYRAAQMNRDLWFTCPVLDFTYYHALYSPSEMTVPTYIYEANTTRFGPIFANIMHVPFWGVSHLSDIPYMLNNDVGAGGDNSPAAKNLAKEMSRSLVRFAYTGNPGDGWPKAFVKKDGKIDADEISMMLWRQEGSGYGGPVTIRKDVTGTEDERTKSVQWEKLFERCNFINSPEVLKEIGV